MRQYQWIMGASGYVGQHIFNAAVEQTDDSSKLVLFGHRNIPYKRFERFNTITADLKRFDFDWYDRFTPKHIFFSARIAGGNPSRRKKAGESGRKANERFLQELKFKGFQDNLVYVSGSLNYGNQPKGTLANEQTNICPTGYAKYYGMAEKPFLDTMGMKVKMARPAWILGPDSWFKVFFWQWARQTKTVPYFGTGEQMMSVLSVADCGRLVYRLKDYDVKVQNLCTYPPISQREFSEMVAEVLQLETVQVSREELAQKLDLDTVEALCSNIPLTTNHPEFYRGFTPEFPSLKELVKRTLYVLNASSSF